MSKKYQFRPKGEYYCKLDTDTEIALTGMMNKQGLSRPEGKEVSARPVS